ncbi:MAG: 3,4-dihydroxy-2-butanone-4-phosphate synthase [Actinomycetota bacterium]
MSVAASTAIAAENPSPINLAAVQTAVNDAIRAVRSGRAVALFDDNDREDECDLVIPAEVMDEAMMALFIRECSGIVCLCLDEARVRRLQLPPMVVSNESRFRTAFTVSIEARHGVSTGVSALDRLTTIRAAIADAAQPEDLVSPGHVFPLRAHPQGVLGRRGHTEGSVDLARLAGFKPAAVLCELMHPDGSMMRGRAARDFAKRRGFPILSIAQLAAFRQHAGI